MEQRVKELESFPWIKSVKPLSDTLFQIHYYNTGNNWKNRGNDWKIELNLQGRVGHWDGGNGNDIFSFDPSQRVFGYGPAICVGGLVNQAAVSRIVDDKDICSLMCYFHKLVTENHDLYMSQTALMNQYGYKCYDSGERGKF